MWTSCKNIPFVPYQLFGRNSVTVKVVKNESINTFNNQLLDY